MNASEISTIARRKRGMLIHQPTGMKFSVLGSSSVKLQNGYEKKVIIFKGCGCDPEVLIRVPTDFQYFKEETFDER